MLSPLFAFAEDHIHAIVAQWMVTAYVQSEEYEKRKLIPGFLDEVEREATWLLRHILQQTQKGFAIDYRLVENIGEDRKEMGTSQTEFIRSCSDLCHILICYIQQAIDTQQIKPSQEDYQTFQRDVHTIFRQVCLHIEKGYASP